MRAFARFLFIPELIIVFQGCTDNKNKAHVTVSSSAFEISASITPQFVKSSGSESSILGAITIKNVTAVPRKFGTQSLYLKVNGELTSRTYKDSNATEKINVETIKIDAHSSLSFPAYWIYNVPGDTKIKSLQFLLQESE
jgi:uncharacterized lipoprotein YehR (DUF1307 family)